MGGVPLMAPARGSAFLCILVWIRNGTTRTDVNLGSAVGNLRLSSCCGTTFSHEA
ncbi:unnamed protein product [Staurois parvus]|uniref:Uncharacterized protein n=1 Tax=Staurois parvus TaxID=386267 RepID=A0ABN9H9P7_9NEOB|nr:unnamed protein product [Staurois parvus]